MGTIETSAPGKVKCSVEHVLKTGRNIIGKQVRHLRYERGLSQPALAAQCQLLGWDISRDTIAKIEAENRWVGDFELVFLARSLDVPLEDLFSSPVRKSIPRKVP